MVLSNNINATNNPYLKEQTDNEYKKATQNQQPQDIDLEQKMQKSAVEVSISMNAQIVLYSMDSSELSKGNITAQKDIFDFLSGKELEDGSSLADIGYEGKPITELSVEEATELVSDGGFFGVEQTSDRVANFVFSFANDDPEIIKKGLEGVIKGFEEAKELWGGELPEISYETQERTLQLINDKLAQLESTATEE